MYSFPHLQLHRSAAARRFALVLCSLLGLGLGARGDESAPVAAPPGPPPFQSEPVEVALGDHGGTVTLMITEDSDYTLDGEPFTGGPDNPVEGAGGRTYVLTLADGTWAAAFVPVTQTVSLGTSGEEVELLTTEAGTWTLADAALAGEGSDTYTTAGRDYVLELGDDGTWTASFVPMTQSVTLGTSGDTVTLTSTEAGSWALDSSSVADGYVATAENGSRYSLTLGDDGTWAAAFVPTAVPVSLGASGESVTLMTTEAGGYTLDGTAVEAGSSLTSTAGERYSLALGDDGMWMATHLPDQRTVLLGNSGVTIELMTSETGTWMRGDASVSSGEIVDGGINEISGAANQYELTLADGTWTATYRPETQSIKGTGLTASAREDGQGYTVGGATLPASGAGELAAADGALYRVAKGADGTLAGARFDQPVVGDVMHQNSIGTHDAPSLSTDDRKTDTDETGTLLNVLGASLSMSDLLGAGTAVASGPNMVAGARQQMVKIRDRAAGLVALRRDGGLDSESFRVQVGRQWAAADTLVNRLFGTSGATLERTTSVSRVVDAFDRIVDALSSEEAFAAATLADGPNQLQGFKTRNATQAVQAFNRVAWTASGTLGTLGSTRFGAAVYNSTDNVTAGLGDADLAQGFAWSTMEATRRASDVQTSGEAYYMGVTHAADQDGNLYEGDIDVLVRFATEKVDGLVSQLARTDTGAFWSYGLGGEGDQHHAAARRAEPARRLESPGAQRRRPPDLRSAGGQQRGFRLQRRRILGPAAGPRRRGRRGGARDVEGGDRQQRTGWRLRGRARREPSPASGGYPRAESLPSRPGGSRLGGPRHGGPGGSGGGLRSRESIPSGPRGQRLQCDGGRNGRGLVPQRRAVGVPGPKPVPRRLVDVQRGPDRGHVGSGHRQHGSRCCGSGRSDSEWSGDAPGGFRRLSRRAPSGQYQRQSRDPQDHHRPHQQQADRGGGQFNRARDLEVLRSAEVRGGIGDDLRGRLLGGIARRIGAKREPRD